MSCLGVSHSEPLTARASEASRSIMSAVSICDEMSSTPVPVPSLPLRRSTGDDASRLDAADLVDDDDGDPESRDLATSMRPRMSSSALERTEPFERRLLMERRLELLATDASSSPPPPPPLVRLNSRRVVADSPACGRRRRGASLVVGTEESRGAPPPPPPGRGGGPRLRDLDREGGLPPPTPGAPRDDRPGDGRGADEGDVVVVGVRLRLLARWFASGPSPPPPPATEEDLGGRGRRGLGVGRGRGEGAASGENALPPARDREGLGLARGGTARGRDEERRGATGGTVGMFMRIGVGEGARLRGLPKALTCRSSNILSS